MKKSFMVFVALLLIASCYGGDAPRPEVAKAAAGNVVYSKDDRTGLCFASVTSTTHAGYQVVSITNVPCTPEVEKLVQK